MIIGDFEIIQAKLKAKLIKSLPEIRRIYGNIEESLTKQPDHKIFGSLYPEEAMEMIVEIEICLRDGRITYIELGTDDEELKKLKRNVAIIKLRHSYLALKDAGLSQLIGAKNRVNPFVFPMHSYTSVTTRFVGKTITIEDALIKDSEHRRILQLIEQARSARERE